MHDFEKRAALQPMMNLVPTVVEQTSRGERAYIVS